MYEEMGRSLIACVGRSALEQPLAGAGNWERPTKSAERMRAKSQASRKCIPGAAEERWSSYLNQLRDVRRGIERERLDRDPCLLPSQQGVAQIDLRLN